MSQLNSTNGNGNRYWHLGREVPLALIATIAIGIMTQTVIGVWWASSISQRLTDVEQRQLTIQPQAENRIIRLETKLEHISETLAEIKSLLRKPEK